MKLKSHVISTICIMALSLCVSPLRAQTSAETASWLQSKLRGHCPPDRDCSDYQVTPTKIRHMETNSTHYLTFFRSLTDVVQARGRTGNIVLRFVGPSFQDCSEDETACNNDADLGISIAPDTPQSEVDRIIKAIKHLAELNGAKLVNDDLFKP
jgi:hypothetical protein